MMHDFHCTHDPCKCEDVTTTDDLLYTAWAIIANARDWLITDDQAQEWVDAAERWRDEWHKTLPEPVDRQPEALETDVERLWRIVGESTGHASTCWVGGTGGAVFDSSEARKVVHKLINTLAEEGYIDRFYQLAPKGY